MDWYSVFYIFANSGLLMVVVSNQYFFRNKFTICFCNHPPPPQKKAAMECFKKMYKYYFSLNKSGVEITIWALRTNGDKMGIWQHIFLFLTVELWNVLHTLAMFNAFNFNSLSTKTWDLMCPQVLYMCSYVS